MVELLPSGSEKWAWLTRRLVEFTSSGSVLIFVTKKANSDELATNLQQEGYSLGLLHGDMDQSERNKVISDFKKKNLPVLVATDVAGEYEVTTREAFCFLSVQMNFVCLCLRSSWSGHPVHSHSGKLRRGAGHRHAHSQDRSNGSCRGERRGLHPPHQQRHNFCWRPGAQLGGSQSGCFQRTHGFSHAGEIKKINK